VRFYPPASLTITKVYANISNSTSTDVVFILKKNGTSFGTSFTITAGQYTLTATTVSVAMTESDYLTLDLVSGTAADLIIKLQYT
jgi:hypothetical protein